MSFVTGNMEYLRAPFVANVKPGHRFLILSESAYHACRFKARGIPGHAKRGRVS